MGLDEATCMLLLGITLLSPDRPGLTEKSKISEIQEKFVDHLEKYVKWRFGPSRGQVNYLFILESNTIESRRNTIYFICLDCFTIKKKSSLKNNFLKFEMQQLPFNVC
jgi:hypothetical protein